MRRLFAALGGTAGTRSLVPVEPARSDHRQWGDAERDGVVVLSPGWHHQGRFRSSRCCHQQMLLWSPKPEQRQQVAGDSDQMPLAINLPQAKQKQLPQPSASFIRPFQSSYLIKIDLSSFKLSASNSSLPRSRPSQTMVETK